jgi:hypothetical protein
LLLRPTAENHRSTLPEQMSESAEIWIRDPIGVPRYSPQSETPYDFLIDANSFLNHHFEFSDLFQLKNQQ